MANLTEKIISVFIPTYNGEKYIGESIEAVLAQKLPDDYRLELIIIDSSSSDKTIEIIKKHGKRVRFSTINKGEFGHGKTRQKAAEMATGEFIAFLTQDATPFDEYWLANLIEPFLISDKVGCVFGRQIPRQNAPPTIKREINTAFGAIGPPDSMILQRYQSFTDGHDTNALNSFFSDVNSVVRRSLLLGEVPFRDVVYAEDQVLAEDMQKHGYIKAYAPLGAVWHSNEYTTTEFYRRKFDEYSALIRLGKLQLVPSLKELFFGWIKPSLYDYRYMLQDPDNSERDKLRWLFVAPQYNISVQKGKYLAAKLHGKDPRLSREHSQEWHES